MSSGDGRLNLRSLGEVAVSRLSAEVEGWMEQIPSILIHRRSFSCRTEMIEIREGWDNSFRGHR